MLTLTPLSPRALEIAAEGRIAPADVRAALNQIEALLNAAGHIDLLADVRGSPQFGLDVILEELKRLPLVFRLIRELDRVAIVADEPWVRAASRLESALIPGLHYEVYQRSEAAHARAWLLRETEAPRPT